MFGVPPLRRSGSNFFAHSNRGTHHDARSTDGRTRAHQGGTQHAIGIQLLALPKMAVPTLIVLLPLALLASHAIDHLELTLDPEGAASDGVISMDHLELALAPEGAAADGVIYITRHAEKSCWNCCINTAGEERADALPHIFNGRTRISNGTTLPPLLTPGALYAFLYADGEDCERCIETLTPISQHLGVPIQHSKNISDKTLPMVEAAATIKKVLASQQRDGAVPVVLVAWEHHRIRLLTASLGVPEDRIPEWPHADFDTVFVLAYRGATLSSFHITEEGLWSGNSSTS
jgi:hypothetical protein